MNPKISVIVPIYNSERNLSRCIESIINQTYKEIELILINDGSRDRSGQICDLYAEKDDRIIVVHKNNSGVSDTRNEGIKLSSGKYLQFVDSDDYLDENMIEILLNVVQHGDPDMVICGYKIIDNRTGNYVLTDYLQDEMNFGFERFLAIYADLYLKNYLNSPWNKMYKASLIEKEKILFEPKLDLGEDLIFNLEVIKKCDKFSFIYSCPYNYVEYNHETLSAKYRENLYEIIKSLFKQVIELYTDVDNYAAEINKMQQAYTRTLLTNVVLHIADHICLRDYDIYLKKAKKVRQDEILTQTINNIELYSNREKLLALLFQHNMYLFIFIYTKIRIFIKNML